MTLLQLIDELKSRPGNSTVDLWARTCLLMLEQFLYSSAAQNKSAPLIRDTVSVQRILNNFVIASIPCWLIGLWNLGYQLNLALFDLGLTQLPGWRGGLLSSLGFGFDASNILACFVHGLLYFLPIFLVALLVGAFWNAVFSLVRGRCLDQGLLFCAWLFALVLPAGAPLYLVALGMTFGVVVGKHLYGGTGRYLFNPVVLSLIFLWLAYPALVFGDGSWVPVPGFAVTTALELAAVGGVEAMLGSGLGWWELFLGVRPGPIGMTSVLGSLLGAGYLIVTGSASWRVMVGVLAGSIATVLVFNSVAEEGNRLLGLPLTWHLMLGGLCFGAVFFATDPVAGAMTNPGRWAFGVLVGLLAMVIRLANPSFAESVLFAVFLASLFSPLMDFTVVELNIRRRRKRLLEIDHGQ